MPRRLVATLPALGVLGVVLWAAGLLPGASVRRAAGQEATASAESQTDASVPARGVVMLGATPAEAGGDGSEVWGLGSGPAGPAVVRYTTAGGWVLGPPLQDESGAPLAGFELDRPQSFNGSVQSALSGQLTPDGAGALLGSLHATTQVLLTREPGNPANPFQQVKAVPAADLEPGEALFSQSRAPLLAPLDEGGHTGAFVVPTLEHGTTGERWVLHWEGAAREWKREAIERPSGAVEGEFHVVGIGASSPDDAWLLAQIAEGKDALFRRHTAEGEAASWRPVAFKSGGSPGEPVEVDGEDIVVPGQESESVLSQALTVTERGVWIDGERPAAKASTTIFYNPGGEGGPSVTSWCTLERSPPNTAPCGNSLPLPLPTGASRSIAWSGSPPYGERVITGLPEGMTLRLQGEEFVPVLGVGGEQGAGFGAAFANPTEGWLGSEALPLHITKAPAPNRLTPWPSAFRRPLLAVAPQPGVPVGALSSQALAVGDLGEVARYEPGVGWLPETLFGPNAKSQHPRLRAVAWPTPNRIYAVGDGQRGGELAMWLWRGETGLWEPDPAEPRNFRGNLLGIAFDPSNPARGYAVGQSGVLLRFGKSWTQDAYPSEAPCSARESSNAEEVRRCSTWTDASFTSVAFAGSEAIAAYRVLPRHDQNAYDGGLIVNEGSGWHVDREAASMMAGRVPWAVGGLPDGGAAFSASGSVFEREGAGNPWHATPTPFPGGGEPGTLTLYREGGSLRVIAAGSAPGTYRAESEPEAPPGSPPTLPGEYPLPSSEMSALLRQTASGWSDEEHELNAARQPPGNWKDFDSVYEPDAVAAVIVDPSGSAGWAVGGTVEPEEHGGVLDTTVVARYRDGSSPPGRGAYAVASSQPGVATIAVGGGAQCVAACWQRARARILPDVSLASALARASSAGVQAFVYTGPRLPDTSPNAFEGKKNAADRLSYPFELGRYAGIMASSTVPSYVALTPAELDEGLSATTFETAFEGFPAPLGKVGCGGCQGTYYAVERGGVRVIVLDDSSETRLGEQEGWLKEQLVSASAAGRPAVVAGNANLVAEVAEGNHPAASRIAAILTGAAGNSNAAASAYFFDAPEENVQQALDVAGGVPVPTFGSGTLGYVSFAHEQSQAFNGASGFLLASVELATRSATTNQARLHVSLIPNIEELALEAKDGLLLHRSQSALFAALARRPRSGNRTPRGQFQPDTNPYIKIPANCVGATCETTAILPEYEFTSSKPEIGDFVAPNLAVSDPHAVLLAGAGETPVHDAKSGLFCAYNKGQTNVTIRTGGLEYTLPVTVQAGSVRRPCGTTRLKEVPVTATAPVPAPPPSPAPAPAGTPPVSLTLPSPVPAPVTPAAIVVPAKAAPVAQLPPFVPLPGLTSPIFAAVPPPLPTPARPAPPSGTSTVTQPVAEQEEDEEEATEQVSNQAVAYRERENEPTGVYILGVVLLAAFAGAAVWRPRRRGRRSVQIAPATISTLRSQRRWQGERRRRL